MNTRPRPPAVSPSPLSPPNQPYLEAGGAAELWPDKWDFQVQGLDRREGPGVN